MIGRRLLILVSTVVVPLYGTVSKRVGQEHTDQEQLTNTIASLIIDSRLAESCVPSIMASPSKRAYKSTRLQPEALELQPNRPRHHATSQTVNVM